MFVVTLRLRRSEWRVLACLARFPDEHWGRRGKEAAPMTRLYKRGLIGQGSEPGRIVMTERGRLAYLTHPINWGRAEGPANCH